MGLEALAPAPNEYAKAVYDSEKAAMEAGQYRESAPTHVQVLCPVCYNPIWRERWYTRAGLAKHLSEFHRRIDTNDLLSLADAVTTKRIEFARNCRCGRSA